MDEVSQAHTGSAHRHMGYWSFVFVAFFWVIGGMYGMETTVAMAPPFYVLLGLCLCPIFYAVPATFICVDLASAYPFDGGQVAWVEFAWGPFIGGHNMYWTWANFVLSAAVYPVLAAGYIVDAVGLSSEWKYMWTQCFVILIAILRLFNLNILAKFSTVLMLMSVIPTLMYIGFMLPHDADGSVWLSTTGKSNCTGLLNASYGLTSPLHESHYAHCEKTDLDLGELFPQMLFIWGGFNALGTLAGEVQNPGRNIPLSTLILLPGIFLIYVVPMIVSLPIEPDQTQYVSGFYGTLAERIVGKWFKMVLTISAVASLFGYTNATIIVSDESFQGFCLRRRPKFFARIRKSGNRFKRWLFDTENRVAPSIALFNSIFLSAAVLLPYQFLISASMVLGNIGMILTFGAYIRLKKSQPDASWVYKFTWHRAILLAFCPAIVVLMQAGLALFDYPVTLGIPFINLVSTAGIIGTGLTAHGIYSLFARKYKIKSLLTDEGDLDNSGESKPLLINKEY